MRLLISSVLVLAIAGCGGSSSGTKPDTTTPGNVMSTTPSTNPSTTTTNTSTSSNTGTTAVPTVNDFNAQAMESLKVQCDWTCGIAVTWKVFAITDEMSEAMIVATTSTTNVVVTLPDQFGGKTATLWTQAVDANGVLTGPESNKTEVMVDAPFDNSPWLCYAGHYDNCVNGDSGARASTDCVVGDTTFACSGIFHERPLVDDRFTFVGCRKFTVPAFDGGQITCDR